MFCFHDGLREFTFSDGAVIKWCRYCSVFDTKRIAVLGSGRVERVHTQQQRWDLILNQAGFDMDAGLHDWLLVDTAITRQSLSRRQTPITYSTLDDHNWDLRQTSFPHSEPMPRALRNFCPHCTEQVGPRKTTGCYLPVEHECPRTRVYDIRGELLEVI